MNYILMGIISGIVTGTGMGGGTVLIFLLTFFCSINQHVAQATNLIYFIPTSISAIIVNAKNKNIDVKLAIYISIFGIIGSLFGAKLATNTNVEDLKKYFGYFLAIIAIHEIYVILKEYIKKKKSNNNKWKKLIRKWL